VKTQYQLITLDVWDTLLRRRCHPDAVKIHVSNFLLNNYFTDIKPEFRNASRLTQERQAAEGKVGQYYRSLGMDDEYALLEVYRHWLQVVFITRENSESVVLTLERVEVDQEKHVIYADPDIEEFLEAYRSVSRVFVSDFYMGAEKLLALMKHVDLGHLVDRGYSSCEHYLNKRSGRIFQYVLEKEKIDAGSVMHIGDNLHSDVRVPQALGIDSIAYLPKAESASRAILKKEFEERQKSISDLALRQKMSQMQSCRETGIVRELYEYGLLCAPLIIGFVLFIMEQSIRQRHEKVYFFTREGEFFKAVYDVLLERQPLGQQAPPSEILEVSRLATFGPSLRNFSPIELKRIWNLYSTQSVSALLKSIDVELGAASVHLARHGVDPDEAIRYPWMDHRVLDLLNDPAFVALLNSEVGVKKGLLLSYLEQKGLSAASRSAAIVDIGWRGTIQDNLAYLFPECHFDGYYLGLDRFLNEQPENGRKAAFGPDLNSAESGQMADLFRAVAPLEMLCNSASGSVIGYKLTQGCAVAERVIDSAENAVIDRYVTHFQRGVVDFAAVFAETIRTHAISAAELRPLAMEIWKRIVSKPSPAVAMAYFQLNHNEQFGVGGFKDKSRRIAISHWARALTSPTGLRDLTVQLEETGWPEGYLARSNLLFVWSAIKRLRLFKRRMVEMIR
jgi:predicted HAD superfamily hydrolase